MPPLSVPGGLPQSRQNAAIVDRVHAGSNVSLAAVDLDNQVNTFLKTAADRVHANNAVLRRFNSLVASSHTDPAIVESKEPNIDLQERYDKLREALVRDLGQYLNFYESYRDLLVKYNKLLSVPLGFKNKVEQIKAISTQTKVQSLCDLLLDELDNALPNVELEQAKAKIAYLERQLARRKG